MKITKHIHSCLLFEEGGTRLLFDPGKFSFTDGRQDPGDFDRLDFVVITHRHPDHLHLPALKPIVERTGATIVTNGEVAAEISDEGFSVEILEEGEREFGSLRLEAVPTRHEAILTRALPRHTSFVVNGRVLNTADSLDPTMHRFAGIELLILPVMGPFLTEVGAMDFAKEMRPGAVLPVHDGYARDWFLEQRYQAFAPFLAQAGIGFHPLEERGGSIEI